jgi:hypothetical protein
MRPNFPSQMAHRLAASSRRYRGLLHIFASCGSLWVVHETQMTPDLKTNLLHHGVADTLGSIAAIMPARLSREFEEQFGEPLYGYGIADRLCRHSDAAARGRCIQQHLTLFVSS